MSYQVLARKWRPRTFKELVGQVHVLQALVNALDNDRLHHAYLFTGTRGVGKTTIARILAKCLNCETGVTSEPCGECAACREIDEGRFVDLIEVDAASRTRLEDTKELLDNVQYAPTRGRFKVYLIDEVHMLSTHSFNALLKTLEEPPPHIKFLLATTDPHKLPITILSRCLQFSLKNMPPEKVVAHLQNVLEKESVPFEKTALWQLGRAADGSMRDALSLTDQAIAYCGDTLTAQGVTAMLGTIDQDQVFKVLEALVAGEASRVLDAVAELAEHSPDYVAVLADMLSALHRVALAQAVPDVVDNSQGDREHILDFAGRITAEDIQLYYQTGLIGRRDLPLAPDPRSGFEMVLLRMLAFRPDGVPCAPTQPLPGREQQDSQASPDVPAEKDEPEPASSAPAVSASIESQLPVSKDEVVQDAVPQNVVRQDVVSQETVLPESIPEPVVSAPPVAEDPPPWSEGPVPSAMPDSPPLDAYHDVPVVNDLAGMPERDTPPVSERVPEPVVNRQPAPVSAGAEPLQRDSAVGQVIDSEFTGVRSEPKETPKPEEVPDDETPQIALSDLQISDWIPLSQSLKMGGVTGAIASHCELSSVAGHSLLLRLDKAHDTLYSDTHRVRIQEALKAYFSTPIELSVETGDIVTETPAAWRERRRLERLAAARESFMNDDRVVAIVEAFSGTIQEHTIEPVG